MRTLSVAMFLAILILPIAAFAQVQTFTATHTYILGDHDSKDDARQRCLLEAKRKVLEQAGVYIESASEVKDFDLTKDKITSFAATVMQVRDTKEEVGFQQGHMTLTLTLTAAVDLAETREQLTAQQADKDVRDDVVLQEERLKRLEAQLELLWQQQQVRTPEQVSVPPASELSLAELKYLRAQAIKGDVDAQFVLGVLHDKGLHGVQQDYVLARQWYEKAEKEKRVRSCLLL